MQKKIIIIFIINLLTILFEIFIGLYSNSLSLISDALHNFNDLIAILISFLAIVYRNKKPDIKMTYGYIRSEMMAGFINSAFLIIILIILSIQAIHRLFHPESLKSIQIIIVSSIAFITNSISVVLLKNLNIHKDKLHIHNNDLNIKSLIYHLISDAGISLGIVICGIIMFYTNYYWIDPLFTIVFSSYIITKTFQILKETFMSLMDSGINKIIEVEKIILNNKNIESIHDIHITRPSSEDIYFSAHLVFKENISLDNIEIILEEIRNDLKKIGITHSLFQPETKKYNNESKFCNSH